MQPLDLKSIEERPIPSKKEKLVRVRFTYEGYQGRTIAWNNKYPSLKAAEQAIKDAWTKQEAQTAGLILLSAEIL